jgi:hypothetical protein
MPRLLAAMMLCLMVGTWLGRIEGLSRRTTLTERHAAAAFVLSGENMLLSLSTGILTGTGARVERMLDTSSTT